MRIWKNKTGRYQNISVDEQVEVKGKTILSKAVIIDHNLNNFWWWLEKHKDYATREAESYLAFKKKNNNYKTSSNDVTKVKQNKKFKIYYKFPIFIRPVILFLYSFIYKLGFLSGVKGLVFYLFQTLWYRMLVDIYIFKKRFNK